jgi:hypothetical protein
LQPGPSALAVSVGRMGFFGGVFFLILGFMLVTPSFAWLARHFDPTALSCLGSHPNFSSGIEMWEIRGNFLGWSCMWRPGHVCAVYSICVLLWL